MEAITWKCDCGTEGTGFLPDECPTCGNYGNDRKPTEAGFRGMMEAHQMLRRRAEEITSILGFGCDSLDFSYPDTFETKWESANCRCGCSGYSTHTEDIPTRYLWMSDTDIQAEVEAKKAAALKVKEEAERQKKLREAQAQVAAAQARAATAQADAERALARAAADLAALQGVSP